MNLEIFQEINDMVLAGPNDDFKVIGRLEWENSKNRNEILRVVDIEGEYDEQYFLEENKQECLKGSRGTEYIDSKELKVLGKNLFMCIQKGLTGLAITHTFIQKDGYVYYIIATADPDDYERASSLTAYMFSKILNNCNTCYY